MLGKTSQLQPGHGALEQNLFWMQKEQISSHLWEILLTQQVCLLPHIPPYNLTLKVRVEEEEEGQGCLKGLSSLRTPFLGFFRGMCLQANTRTEWWSEVDVGRAVLLSCQNA